MAKGAGMIAPNMATMLCFATTDAKISQDELQLITQEVVQETFNSVSVDGDMSTNDSVFVYANALSKTYHKDAFKEALKMAFLFLATQLVKDGEGASKLVAFEVKNAKTKEDAQKIAKNVNIPVIGIGAGVEVDGQVLVWSDMLGFFQEFKPKFVKRYLNGAKLTKEALLNYKNEVESGAFPTENEIY